MRGAPRTRRLQCHQANWTGANDCYRIAALNTAAADGSNCDRGCLCQRGRVSCYGGWYWQTRCRWGVAQLGQTAIGHEAERGQLVAQHGQMGLTPAACVARDQRVSGDKVAFTELADSGANRDDGARELVSER